jgi:hypothetical protein
MPVRIYESKNWKFIELVAAISILFLEVLLCYYYDFFIGSYFLILAVFYLVEVIRRLEDYPIIVEYNEETIVLPIKKDHITLRWSDIERAERKFGVSILGVVPSIVVIYLRSGQVVKVKLPDLTIKEEVLVSIINEKSSH